MTSQAKAKPAPALSRQAYREAKSQACRKAALARWAKRKEPPKQ